MIVFLKSMIRVSKKKKKAGVLPNHRVIAMVDYILDHRIYADQKQLASAAGLTDTSISRMKSGQIKNPTVNSLMKINDACGGIFNLDYLRGRSNTMLVKDVAKPANEPVATEQPVSNAELSSYANSALASKDETIEALKSKLSDRDQLVDELREQLAEKRRDRADLQDQLKQLRMELEAVKAERDQLRSRLADEDLTNYPFKMGVSEPGGSAFMVSDEPSATAPEGTVVGSPSLQHTEKPYPRVKKNKR